jgi:4-alpha-glucanotransferase
MKIQFYLRFHTLLGQSIWISGNIEALGNNHPENALPLKYMDEEFWHGTIECDPVRMSTIRYVYLLRNEDGSLIKEWGDDREIEILKKEIDEIQAIDTWNHAGEFENVFFTAPFQQILLKHYPAAVKKKPPKSFTHIFKVKAPLLRKDEALCLIGSAAKLGEWNEEDALPMTLEKNWWVRKVNLPKESFPLTYKYGVYSTRNQKFLQYETGNNRILHGDALKNKYTMLQDGFAALPNNTWRGAGVAIPVFSLRSERGTGVGEFTDLKLLVDWAKKAGMKLIQILPVNDTSATHTWLDSYPYAAISAFALHPLYLNLEEVAGKEFLSTVKPYHRMQKQLDALPDLDYEELMKIKKAAIKELYQLQKENFLADPGYLRFFEDNRHWLEPYAAFCYLRDRNGFADFTRWKIYKKYDREGIDKYVSPKARHFDSIAVQYFAQYHLHRQLRDATDYAHQHGVIVKGDVPIGIYRYSCDAWMEPRLYHMEMQAGAPPDDFARRGQNWGFPTYNWSQMAKDGFTWWKRRFEQMANYFDAFRIDHILGFFRIWSIPMDSVEGIMGNFEPCLPVHRSEFRQRNIWFDHYRYTHPCINDAVLWAFFADQSDYVKANFLHPLGDGFYALNEPFNTQQRVEEYFRGQERTDLNQLLKAGIFNLISNIILMEVPGSKGEKFHFRISMEQTFSFRYLDWKTQEQLKELYTDYFFKRQDHFWQEEAMKKLPPLKRSTNMLVCGEDLGMVPDCVPEVMRQLGILSLEIQRMPKTPGREFGHPGDAPYLSVVTPSTHDMSTVRGWWEEDRERTQRFYNQELGQWGDAPPFCESWISKAILIQHLYSPAMWSIFQLQDIMGMSGKIARENPHDERINVPANPQNYWKYRMHITLEDLIRQKDFNEELKTHTHSSGR